MSKPFEIPSFSEAEIDLEKRRIALLDQLLAENGALGVEDLFNVVRKKDYGSLFAAFSVLKGFIQSRTNLFKADQAVSTKIENRSIDYRKAIHFIVDRLANSNQQRKINYISAELGQHFPTVKRCEIGSGDAALYKFVSEHKSILTFDGPTPLKADQRLVCLHPISRTIPSIWIEETLPEYDSSICRYDRSITISASARVVNAAKATNYLKLEIVSNPYTNETVYALGKNVVGSGNLVSRFPLKSLVKIVAFKAYFAAQPWTATSIEDASAEESAHLEQTHPLTGPQKTSVAEDSNNQTNKLASQNWTGSAPSLVTTKPTLTIQSEKDEQSMIDIIDATIGRQVVLIRSLWVRLQQKQGGVLALKNEAELEHFLSCRPHLYFVNEASVSLRSDLHRQVLLRLISEMKSGTKFTLNSLGARVGTYSAEFKRDVYGSGNAWLQKFVDDHRTLLEIVGPFDPRKTNGQTVQLRYTPLATGPFGRVSSTISPTQQSSIPDPSAQQINGYGVVKKYNKMYGYLTIEGGQYAGNTVYFTASEIKQDCGSINDIALGLQLNFEAVNCDNKGMAHPWRAIGLSLAVDRATPSSVSSDGESGISQTERPHKLPSGVAVKDAAKESTLTKQKSVRVEWPSHSIIVQLETSRKAMVDNFLEYDALSVDALFEKFALASREFFSYHYQMVEFLCIRSHLYLVDFATKSVSRRPKDYRRALSKFLMRCQEEEDCSVEGLRQMALLCKDDTYASVVERCRSKLGFENLLKEHEQLFEMTEVIDDKENRMIRARGTYDFDYDLFLPRYYH